jgi:hypothetical protein
LTLLVNDEALSVHLLIDHGLYIGLNLLHGVGFTRDQVELLGGKLSERVLLHGYN